MPKEDLYQESFIRNIGIFSKLEQEKLKKSCIAIAGMGGVGGAYIVTLTRMGLGKFVIADPDDFSYSNLNRQYGATIETIGENKALVMKRIVKSINPGTEVTVFEGKLNKSNIGEFVAEANVVIDAIDVFEMQVKELLHDEARRKGVYSLRAVPLGFGASLQVFSPCGISFGDYFKMADARSLEDQYQNVLMGIAPVKIHERYLGNQAFNGLSQEQIEPPSVCPAVHLAAAMVATEAVIIILQKRESVTIPRCTQIDLFERVIEIK